MSSTSFATRKPVTVERTIGGKTISIETGRLAKQASGAVVVRIGDTMTLVATVAGPGREGLDFFPLTVDYREKVYAAGKFPGGFIKREGRPTTKEILTSRLIDRPIRPLFPESYRDEVQIQAGPISADRKNDADVLSMIGASATLMLARVPFLGPIGAVRLGRVDGKFVAFPTADELKDSDLDLVVASTDKADRHDRGVRPGVPEPEMDEAIMAAHRLNQEIIALQHELLAAAGPAPVRGPRASRPTRSGRRSTSASATSSARPSRSTARPTGTAPSRSCRSGSSPSTARRGPSRRVHAAPGQGGLPRASRSGSSAS